MNLPIKKIKSLHEFVHYDVASPLRDYARGELVSTEVIGENGRIEIIKEVFSGFPDWSTKTSTNFTDVDLGEVNKELINQIKDSLFEGEEFYAHTYHPVLSISPSEYDWMIENSKIVYEDDSEIELKCVDYSSTHFEHEWITCSLSFDDEYYYLVNQHASFEYRAIVKK